MTQMFNPFTPPGGGNLPQPSGGSPSGLSPGAIASTGGLLGTNGALLIASFNPIVNTSWLSIWDSNDFNCEEDCVYYFPQENVKVGYAVSSYKLIVIYRNLGKVKVTFNITTFRQGLTTYKNGVAVIELGAFNTESKTMILGSVRPDNKLYTTSFNIINSGDRPQAWIFRKAGDGPLSIASVTMCGNADETSKI